MTDLNPDAPGASGTFDPAGVASVDAALAQRLVTSADMLTGLLAAGLLEHAGRPAKLPRMMWPDLPDELVQEIWDAGLAVGLRAGRATSRHRWDTTDLDRARHDLREAGYTAMAAQADVTATTARMPRTGHGHSPGHWADMQAGARGGHP